MGLIPYWLLICNVKGFNVKACMGVTTVTYVTNVGRAAAGLGFKIHSTPDRVDVYIKPVEAKECHQLIQSSIHVQIDRVSCANPKCPFFGLLNWACVQSTPVSNGLAQGLKYPGVDPRVKTMQRIVESIDDILCDNHSIRSLQVQHRGLK